MVKGCANHRIEQGRIGVALVGQQLTDHIPQQGDAAHGGAGGHTEALVGVVQAVEHPLVEDRGVGGDQGVAGVAQEVVHVPQAGREPAGGVGVAAGQDQLRVGQPQALGGFAHDGGRLTVDQLHGGQAQLRLREVGLDAIDGLAIEVTAELVVTADQTGDGIPHGVELDRTSLAGNLAVANGENPGQRWLLADLTETVTQTGSAASQGFCYS